MFSEFESILRRHGPSVKNEQVVLLKRKLVSEEETEAVAHSNCRLRHTQNESNSVRRIPKLDVALWSGLADDLQVKSIPRFPLHPLFRASTLSKEWHHRFYSAPFEHEVHCRSTTSWSSFCHLLVTDKKALLGFNSSSGLWCPLPSLSYLRYEGHEWKLIGTCGSLVCLTEK